jgi:AcrR family transcriptional regulator
VRLNSQTTQADEDSDLLAPDESLGARERILHASLELFVKKGYFNTNVPDISKLSRCSVGSIYHHFLNKEEIAKQLYSDGIQKFRIALADLIEENDPLETTIQNIVISFLTFAETHKTLSRYIWLSRHSEFLSGQVLKPTTVGFDNLGRRLTKAIKQGIRKGEMPNVKAEIFWSIVFGIPLSFIRDWLEGHTSQPPHAVAATIAKACWAGLTGIKGK